MANIFDNDILITKGDGNVYMDLTCGYGQPSVTTVYLQKSDGTASELRSFDNNTSNLQIGTVLSLKYSSIEIHTTIDDIRDSDSEKEDISLEVVVYDAQSNKVDTSFTKKTKGKGHKFHSFYTVAII